jgi:predicted transcriptional regulator
MKYMSHINLSPSNTAKWTFLTNHTHVLVCVLREPFIRSRDIAEKVGITERSVMRILKELMEYGVLSVEKDGRRNRYAVDTTRRLRHSMEDKCTVGELLAFVLEHEPR